MYMYMYMYMYIAYMCVNFVGICVLYILQSSTCVHYNLYNIMWIVLKFQMEYLHVYCFTSLQCFGSHHQQVAAPHQLVWGAL